ncbi:ABC transporter permease [Clostridium hydrogeniformans]|uniref:ABC transporter permease n=1 Tax=Clostridium hydrogeniformans TaxID=349933 RepID=UPI00048707AC|nr:ABC transporter permease [Clostridium hydrogeniformans]
MIATLNNEFIKVFKGSKRFKAFLIILLMMSMISTIIIKVSKGNLTVDDVIVSNMIMSLEILPIYIAILSSDMITDDYRNGTLKMTILQPISRGEIIIGKALFLIIFTTLLMTFNIIFTTFFSGFILGGMPHSKELFMFLIKGFLTSIILGAFGMVTIFISLIMNSSGAATGAGIGALFAIRITSVTMATYKILPSAFSGVFITNIFDLFLRERGNIPFEKFIISMIFTGAYYLCFYILAKKTFEMKEIIY